MDNNKWLIFIELFLILLFPAVEVILCIDRQFLACLPKSCGAGSPNISYPFWIHGSQNSTCGFPGFELHCSQSEPILRISGEQYVVKRIVYEEQSLFISKFGALESEFCSPATYNLRLYRSPFSFVPGGVNISIFFNCSVALSDVYSPYSLGCSTDNATGHSFALFSDNPLLNHLNQSGVCERFVSAPVNMTSSERNTDAVDFLTNVGFDLKWNASRCDECAASGGRCGFDYSMYKFMCFCPEGPHHRRCENRNRANMGPKVAIGTITGVVGLILMALLFALWKCRRSSSTFKILWKRQNKTQRLVEDFLKSHGSFVPKRYNYYDIKKMTNSFKDKIGQGGYGEVYKGKLLDGRLVAVKLLNDDKGTGGQEFINEVASISMTSHVNIVSLLGFCFDGSKRALIYEFMANGSLEKYIYNCQLEDQPHLGWETLYQIAIGVARGLEYLHRGCNTRILHFDIKPHNIILDIDFTPKISDFGLAKLCPRKESIISMLDARGTAGYIAPEVFNRQFGGVSHKSDVYSYGMMVLEVIGKRKNVDVRVNHTSEIYFPDWIYKRLVIGDDLGLNGIISAEEKDTARKMTLVALWCIQTNPMDRPAMTRVVEMLEGTLESLSIPPKPYLCSPPRSPQSLVISSSVT